MKLGLLSDTHDHLDPRLEPLFAGVDRILHAGDVCKPMLVAELEAIAPVTVVLGNNDWHPAWRTTEVLDLDGLRILVEHIVDPHRPSPPLRDRLDRHQPHLVVFGHTHRTFDAVVHGIRFLNPGSAGPRRFGATRTVCLLHLEAGGLRAEFHELP